MCLKSSIDSAPFFGWRDYGVNLKGRISRVLIALRQPSPLPRSVLSIWELVEFKMLVFSDGTRIVNCAFSSAADNHTAHLKLAEWDLNFSFVSQIRGLPPGWVRRPCPGVEAGRPWWDRGRVEGGTGADQERHGHGRRDLLFKLLLLDELRDVPYR